MTHCDAKRILVTPRSLSTGQHSSLERLQDLGFELVRPAPGETPSEQALLAAIPACCGWIAGVEPVSPQVIEAAACLRVISRNGSGVDNLPMEIIARRGIKVARAVAANANGVAELALALMLAGFRHIPLNDRGIRATAWPRPMGKEIAGATIGVVGLGAIGSLAAQKFLQLGASVVGYDPFAAPEALSAQPGFTMVTALERLVTQSDGITLHCPQPADNKPLLDAGLLAAARPGVVIVNTARAGLVDADAMLAALDQGTVAAYATDAFATEPPELSALLLHDRSILTSHIGGLTSGSVARVVEMTVDNLLAGLEATND